MKLRINRVRVNKPRTDRLPLNRLRLNRLRLNRLRLNRLRLNRLRLNRLRLGRSWSAAVVACFGMLFVSAGVGLTATAANATKPNPDHQVVVCHATNSDTNPYQVILVDGASTTFEGHLAHRNDPVMTWKKGTWFQDVWHPAGSAKPDLIEGLDANASAGYCDASGSNELRTATASVEITQQPSCDNDGVGRWSASATGATLSAANGQGGSGDSFSTTATAQPGYEFTGGSSTKVLSGTFDTFDSSKCEVVEPPARIKIAPPELSQTQPTCTNQGAWGWSVTGQHVTFDPSQSASGTYAQRGTANTTVTVTADEGYEFNDGTTSKVFPVSFDFDYAPEGQSIDESGACSVVEPPVVEPPVVEPPVVAPPAVVLPPTKPAGTAQVAGPKAGGAAQSGSAVIPTLVKAGLPGAPAAGTPTDSTLGMTLSGLGLVLLLTAGGIAIIGRRREEA